MLKEKLSLEEVLNMDLPPLILYAAPFFFIFVLIEWYVGLKNQQKVYDGKDFLAATTVGLVNVILSLFTKTATFAVILFFYNLVPWSIPVSWWSFILCFFVVDFCRYWAHRVGHEQRIWWSTHVTHHSSKQYNFSVGFRLSWIQQFKLIFFLPVALCGFHPFVFFFCHQIAVIYQFWIHTEMIKKMPAWVEFFFVTPSHHRVHHGSDPKYIDKNYGSTFIIWDRMFGTFQPEEERPTYGITKELKRAYNPVYLVFHEFIDVMNDLRYARSFKEGWKVLFSSPGVEVIPESRKVKAVKVPIKKSTEKQPHEVKVPAQVKVSAEVEQSS